MKVSLSVSLLSLTHAAPSVDSNRRYKQLTDMMEHYNANFDERRYWAYGCNCIMLGDRPMSDPGHGPPVDALDVVCKAYKDCLKCARMEYGDLCIGELVQYQYGITDIYGNEEVYCKDGKNTCDRAICECDAKFAREHQPVTSVFDNKYHMFWSTNNGGVMWDPENNPDACPRGHGGGHGLPNQPECCGGYGKPYILYNANRKVCCADGRVANEATGCW